MQLYKKIDLNGDGTIQFNEFVLVALHRDELHSQQKLRAAFDMMDKNGDQTISPDELLEVFSFNENFDIDMAREMIRQVDINADGGIQFDEFNMMMKNIDFEKILGGGSSSSEKNEKETKIGDIGNKKSGKNAWLDWGSTFTLASISRMGIDLN